MQKKLFIFFVLSLAVSLSACAGHSPRTQRILDDAVSAKKISDLRRHKLEHGKKYPYEITDESEAFEFETGKSHAVLFELPEFLDSSTVEVKSYCDCLGFAKNVFIPSGVLFDKGFNKVGELEFSTHPQTFMEPVHFISEAALEERGRYLLVYSDPKGYGKPADRVSANVTRVNKERMDYIRKGMVKETYSSAQVAVWWKGDAVGKIQVLVKDPRK